MIQVELNGLGINVFLNEDAQNEIENILTKNYIRVLKKRTLSFLFELLRIWRRGLASNIIYLSNNFMSITAVSGTVFTYEMFDGMGYINYSPIEQNGSVVALEIIAFDFNLSWRTIENVKILSADEALKEIWAIKSHKMPIYEQKRRIIHITENDLRNIIKQSIQEALIEKR